MAREGAKEQERRSKQRNEATRKRARVSGGDGVGGSGSSPPPVRQGRASTASRGSHPARGQGAAQQGARGRGCGLGGGRGGIGAGGAQGQLTGPLSAELPHHLPIGIRKVNYKSDPKVVRKEQREDPEQYNKMSLDDCFWSIFHQNYYESILYPRIDENPQKFALKAQYLDWNHLIRSTDPVFQAVAKAIEDKGLQHLVTFQYDWCNEILAQF